MKYFNQEKDGEEIPIYPRDKPNVKVNNKNQNQQMNKTDSYPKRNLITFYNNHNITNNIIDNIKIKFRI